MSLVAPAAAEVASTHQGSSQGIPGRAGVGGPAVQPLEAWTPPKPKADAKTGFHDLAHRYRIGAPLGLDKDADS